jgi:hypothetical protein
MDELEKMMLRELPFLFENPLGNPYGIVSSSDTSFTVKRLTKDGEKVKRFIEVQLKQSYKGGYIEGYDSGFDGSLNFTIEAE